MKILTKLHFIIILILVLASSSSLFAISKSSKLPSITSHQLDHMLQYWQNILMLNDWTIRLHLVSIESLPKGTAGLSSCGYKSCDFAILKPSDYAQLANENFLSVKTGKEITKDIENTIVHELVHLRIAEVRHMMLPAEESEMIEEVTVNRITQALIKAHNHILP